MAINIKGLDHYAVAVRHLDRSIDFYHGILGMKLQTRPDFDFNGAWLDCGNHISLHLIEQPDTMFHPSGSRSLHFAFGVDDIYRTKALLIAHQVEIAKDIKSRPDGILQMFVKDPDGYFIEMTQC